MDVNDLDDIGALIPTLNKNYGKIVCIAIFNSTIVSVLPTQPTEERTTKPTSERTLSTLQTYRVQE